MQSLHPQASSNPEYSPVADHARTPNPADARSSHPFLPSLVFRRAEKCALPNPVPIVRTSNPSYPAKCPKVRSGKNVTIGLPMVNLRMNNHRLNSRWFQGKRLKPGVVGGADGQSHTILKLSS